MLLLMMMVMMVWVLDEAADVLGWLEVGLGCVWRGGVEGMVRACK